MSKSTPSPANTTTPTAFKIVGIGASAGGLEPLEHFFTLVEADSNMAYVVIQHLAPDFKSQMEHLLGRKTNLPIHRVEHGDEIKPNHIYLIPPNTTMTIENGQLQLKQRDPSVNPPLPVDDFLVSLAQDCGKRAIAVILSGTGADGSKGVAAISRASGLVVVQGKDTASFDSMPTNAIATGHVHLSLDPNEMPAVLKRYANSGMAPEEFSAGHDPEDESNLSNIMDLIDEHYGLDFSRYKLTTVNRRIKRRTMLMGQSGLNDYIQLLMEDSGELDQLYRDLLIGTTSFFRDTEMFNYLEEHTIPELIEQHTKDNPLRLWITACATGEEAYSIAILVHEALQHAGKRLHVKIFATDVHEGSIKHASQGVYSDTALKGLSPERREKYFSQQHNGYQISTVIRRMVTFAQHNLLNDAPLTKMDLVTCRNFLIYLKPEAQHTLLGRLHFSLKHRSILILGNSETLGRLDEEFNEENSRLRIYRKRYSNRLPIFPPDRNERHGRQARESNKAERTNRSAVDFNSNSNDNTLLPIYDQLLQSFMPPSVLLTEKWEIAHLFSGAERYIELRPGRISNKILDVVSEAIKLPLAGALAQVSDSGKPTQFNSIPYQARNQSAEILNLSVRTITAPRFSTQASFFLVQFETTSHTVTDGAIGETIDITELAEQHIRNLETELRYSQENLQTSIEELQASNEELQASNEELVASNEELQSTNEELQSVNEELHTVNFEHQEKIVELSLAHNDMSNLLEGTRVGVIFLDRNLNIRRFTPVVGEILGLIPEDISRSFLFFGKSLQYPGLERDIREVIETGELIETECLHFKEVPYLVRIVPYLTEQKQATEGVVITLIDLTHIKQAERQANRFQQFSELSHDINLVIESDGSISYVNPAFTDQLGYNSAQAYNLGIARLFADERLAHFNDLCNLTAAHGQHFFETVLLTEGGSAMDVEVTLITFSTDPHKSPVFMTARDIRERKRTREQLMLRTRALESISKGIVIFSASAERSIIYTNAAFRTMTGHELRQPGRDHLKVLYGPQTDQAGIETLNQAIANERADRAELELYKYSGDTFWCEMTISPVRDDNGIISHFIATLRDISAIRLAENKAKAYARQIQLLLNSTEEGIYFIDLSGNCVFCNQSAARLLGYTTSDELVGRNMHSTIHHSDANGKPIPLENCRINNSIRNAKIEGSAEEVFWRHDGTPLEVEYWSHPVVGDQNKVEGSVVTFIDITQRKRNQERLQAMQRAAEEANHNKSIFLANISHELRSPLAAILGYAELMLARPVFNEATDQLSVIKRNCDHLLQLLNDMLDLSKIESGVLTIDEEPCNLLEILADIKAVFEPLAQQKDLESRFEMLSAIPRYATTDPLRLKQIITNLMSNAIKFTESGKIQLTARQFSRNDQRMLEICVTDTGPGISPTTGELLFKPFARGFTPAAKNIPGSGLGLSISYRLAEQLGGELTYDTTENVGTQFRYAFPLKAPSETLSAAGAIIEEPQDRSALARVQINAHVLVVDDREDIRDVFRALLEGWNIQVSTAGDGLAAIRVVNTADTPVDLVLMDLQMPVLDGPEATAQLREAGHTMPILAVTAAAMKGAREQVLAQGFSGYVSKPVRQQQLFTCLREHLAADRIREAVPCQRVLIVDDNADAAAATEALLSMKGHEVRVVREASAVIATVREFTPCAILLDLELGESNGRDLVPLIQQLELPHTPWIIAFTGHNEPELLRALKQEGFNDVLIKPATLQKLEQALGHVSAEPL